MESLVEVDGSGTERMAYWWHDVFCAVIVGRVTMNAMTVLGTVRRARQAFTFIRSLKAWLVRTALLGQHA